MIFAAEVCGGGLDSCDSRQSLTAQLLFAVLFQDAASNIDDASAANRRIYRGQFYTKIILYSTMLVVLAGVVSFILFALKIPPFGHH